MTVRAAGGRILAVLDVAARRPRWSVTAILFVALALRLAAVVIDGPYQPEKDALDYHVLALSIADGEGYTRSNIAAGSEETAFRPPLYPHLLGAVYWLTGEGVPAGRAFGAVAGAALVLLLYCLANALWGRRVALVTASLAAIFPPLALLSLPLMSEQTFLVVIVGAVLGGVLAIRGRHGSLRWATAAGVCCGLAMLTRSNGILVLGLVGLTVLHGFPQPGRRRWLATALLVGAALLTVAPWTARNLSVFERPVLVTTQTGFGVAGLLNDESRLRQDYSGTWVHPIGTRLYGPIYRSPVLDESQVDARVRSKALDWALDHPGYVARSGVENVLRTLELAPNDPVQREVDRELLRLTPTAAELVRWTFWLAGLLSLVGVALIWRRPPLRRGELWIWAIPLLAFVVGAAVLGFTRYRAPLYPFVTLLSALALTRAIERAGGESGVSSA